MSRKKHKPDVQPQGNKKDIRTGKSKKDKYPRTGCAVSTEAQTFIWHIAWIDKEHRHWGWQRLEAGKWLQDVLPKLRDFETMTWAEIQRAAGGRREGNNHHFIDVEGTCREAKRRLVNLECDDCEELFSLRLTNTERIYGIRNGRVFKVLWFDPYHGDDSRAVYPTGE